MLTVGNDCRSSNLETYKSFHYCITVVINSGNENDMIYKVKLLGCAALHVFVTAFEQTFSTVDSVGKSDFKCSFPAKDSPREFEEVLFS